jgi:hypothetical protein
VFLLAFFVGQDALVMRRKIKTQFQKMIQ